MRVKKINKQRQRRWRLNQKQRQHDVANNRASDGSHRWKDKNNREKSNNNNNNDREGDD